MKNKLKQDLVKLGNSNPELRKHIRPVLDRMKAASMSVDDLTRELRQRGWEIHPEDNGWTAEKASMGPMIGYYPGNPDGDYAFHKAYSDPSPKSTVSFKTPGKLLDYIDNNKRAHSRKQASDISRDEFRKALDRYGFQNLKLSGRGNLSARKELDWLRISFHALDGQIFGEIHIDSPHMTMSGNIYEGTGSFEVIQEAAKALNKLRSEIVSLGR